MARPKSEDKHNTILAAAIPLLAERGLGAPTAAISSAAGVAEGTLFTYFRSKDELLNALYRQIKLGLADALMAGFPRKASLRLRLQHVWDQYIAWGMANPSECNVLKKMQVWEGLTCDSKQAGMAPFAEIQAMCQEAIAQRILIELPERFVGALLGAQIEVTMEFMKLEPAKAQMYRALGFEVFWAGITRKK